MQRIRTRYYTYRHRAGYGSDDHLAGELIARAARRLGIDTGDYIAGAAGLASHTVSTAAPQVRVPAGHGISRRRMERVLLEAARELGRRVDCDVEVMEVREVHVAPGDVYDGSRYDDYMILTQEQRGRGWVTVDTRQDAHTDHVWDQMGRQWALTRTRYGWRVEGQGRHQSRLCPTQEAAMAYIRDQC